MTDFITLYTVATATQLTSLAKVIPLPLNLFQEVAGSLFRKSMFCFAIAPYHEGMGDSGLK
ncbi:MAG: hypothetical protein P1U68_10770 [Verrucomicrobiales bacterium]|nr:hypothetical protein [Verrucomicrobiales bacterium]